MIDWRSLWAAMWREVAFAIHVRWVVATAGRRHGAPGSAGQP